MTKAEKSEVRDTLLVITRDLTGAAERTRAKLLADLRSLADNLTAAADGLEKSPEDRFAVNSLGVVQGMGLEIDRGCALFACLLEKRELAAWTIQEATK